MTSMHVMLAALIALTAAVLVVAISTRKVVLHLALVTREEILGLCSVIRRLLRTDSSNRDQIEALKAEIKDAAFLNDPEVNAEVEAVLGEAAEAPVPVPTDGTPAVEDSPAVDQ